MSDQFTELKRTLSHNIKHYRGLKGLSQEKLALEAGVDRTLVSRIERCVVNPTICILQKLATRLEISADLLLKKSDPD